MKDLRAKEEEGLEVSENLLSWEVKNGESRGTDQKRSGK